MRIFVVAAVAFVIGLLPATVAAQDSVRLYAAGSLRAALTAIADRFTAQYLIPVRLEFGASGLRRERLERGEPADVFASANMDHPLALATQGKAGPVVLFARNELCALTRGGLMVTPATLLDVMLDPSIKLATSTPKADPSGDYAWEVFRKADHLRPGSRGRLEQKALQLTGGPNSLQPPTGTSVYAYAIQQQRADLFLTYCTNARLAVGTISGAAAVPLPPSLSVGANYGLMALNGAQAEKALNLILFILSPDGRQILASHGFSAPTRVSP